MLDNMSDSSDENIEKPRQINYVLTPAREEALRKCRERRMEKCKEIRKEKALSQLTKKEKKIKQKLEEIEKGNIPAKVGGISKKQNEKTTPEPVEPKLDISDEFADNPI